MQPIQITFQKRLNQNKLTPVAQAALVVHFANQYFIQKHQYKPQQVRATLLKQSILWVEVAHPIFAQELLGISLQILEEIQQKYPDIKVAQIRTKTLTET